MTDPTPSVGVYVASYNTAAVTELCVRTMRMRAGRPFTLTVGDAGSTDGSVEMLEAFQRRGWLVLETVAERRTHTEWLDRWYAASPYRYIVFSDSDVEYRGDGWLTALVDRAVESGAAIVATRIQARDWPAYTHPVTGAQRRLAPRPEPWLMLIDLEQTRGVVDVGFGYHEETNEHGNCAFDTAAAFFRAVGDAGLGYVEMPAEYQRAYRHFGSMSWRRASDRRLGLRQRVQAALKTIAVRRHLAVARRADRGAPDRRASDPGPTDPGPIQPGSG